MSYRLEANETLAAGVKRIIHEQIDQAIESLRQPGDDRDAAVHDARKRFKKIRAALRLVRDEIGEETYKRENVFYRDLGRRLAEMRDSYVRRETLERLQSDYAEQIDKGAFSDVDEKLEEAHRDMSRRTFEEKNVLGEVADALELARPRIALLPIGEQDFSAIRHSLRRVYKRGYKALDKAYKEPKLATFHEWRKRVKYLWYHTRILRPLWPPMLGELADQIHDLSDYLGDDHDLAEFRNMLQERPHLRSDESEQQLLLGLIDQKQRELHTDARPLGRRIYSEKPDAFVARFAGYWKAWQRELAEEEPTPLLHAAQPQK